MDGMTPDGRLLDEALVWLREVSAARLRPEVALERLCPLRASYADVELDLVWEEEPYSGFVHYDLLLRHPERGVVSLSFCPEREVPWPLRNAHSAPDGVLVRVNGRTVDMAMAMSCLEFLWEETGLAVRLVDVALVRQALERRRFEVTDAELQAALDAFRERHGLFSREETLRFLERRGMSPEVLEQCLEGELLARKLREALTSEQVEPYFEAHRHELDTASVARLRVASEPAARALLARLQAGTLDFFTAAREAYLASGEPGRSALFTTVRRGTLSEEQAERIFGASPLEVVGPFPVEEGHELLCVLQVSSARLDEDTRERLQQRLFEAWLEERRREAVIDWYWGAPVAWRQPRGG